MWLIGKVCSREYIQSFPCQRGGRIILNQLTRNWLVFSLSLFLSLGFWTEQLSSSFARILPAECLNNSTGSVVIELLGRRQSPASSAKQLIFFKWGMIMLRYVALGCRNWFFQLSNEASRVYSDPLLWFDDVGMSLMKATDPIVRCTPIFWLKATGLFVIVWISACLRPVQPNWVGRFDGINSERRRHFRSHM